MGRNHKLGVSVPYTKLGCSKMFSSIVSRDRHQKYCVVDKDFKCQYCKKKYKREGNLKKHNQVVHQKVGIMYLCNLCQKSYQSKTTYSAHYRNNQCYPVEEAPADVEEEEEDDDGEGEEGDQQMPPLEGEGG